MNHSKAFKNRGLSGWYVIMGLDKEGRPDPTLVTHSVSCYVPHQSRSGNHSFGPVPVEEVPNGTELCGHCGGGPYRLWMAGKRP